MLPPHQLPLRLFGEVLKLEAHLGRCYGMVFGGKVADDFIDDVLVATRLAPTICRSLSA